MKSAISSAIRFLYLILVQLSLGFSSITAADSLGRGIELDALVKVEQFGKFLQGGPIAFSADGQRLAFVWQRSQRQNANRQFEVFGDHNADIWIQLEPNTAAINLTQGEQDGAGAWAPQWSPDGEQLALLSTRSGTVGLWVWNIRTRQFKCLTVRRPSMEEFSDQPYAWLDNQRLIYVVEANDARSRLDNFVDETLEPATLGWQSSLEPIKTTAIINHS